MLLVIMYLFHCATLPGKCFNDMYRMDLTTLTWSNLTAKAWGDVPAARYRHGFTSGGGFIYMLGGLSSSNGKL